MAEINQIMGAILRDITEARSMADVYSRDIASQYSKDDLLKFFPVPQVDIKELTIDLRFAIGNVSEDETRISSRQEAVSRGIQNLASEFISQVGIELNKGALPEKISNSLINDQDKLATDKSVSSFKKAFSTRTEFRSTDLESIKTELTKLITQNLTNASGGARELEKHLSEKSINAAADKIFSKILPAAQEELKKASNTPGELKVELLVSADKLHGIPDSAISSFKIVTEMRNLSVSKNANGSTDSLLSE